MSGCGFFANPAIAEKHKGGPQRRVMSKTLSTASVRSDVSSIDRAKNRHASSAAAREEARRKAEELAKKKEEQNKLKRAETLRLRDKAKKAAAPKRKDKPGIPKNLQVGDAVVIKQGLGIVRYIGLVERKKKKKKSPEKRPADNEGEEKEDPPQYVGVELKEQRAQGRNNGTVFGKSYFKTEDGSKKGVFTRRIKRVLQPERILHMLAQEVSKSKQKGRLVNERFDEALAEETALFRMENDQLQARVAELEAQLELHDNRSVNSQLTLNTENSGYVHIVNEDDEKAKDANGKDKPSGSMGLGSANGKPLSPLKNVNSGGNLQPLTGLSVGPDGGPVINLRNSLRAPGAEGRPSRSSLGVPKRAGRALFREKSENFWDDGGAEGLQRDLMAEVERMAKEQRATALEKLHLPNQHAPDNEFKAWLEKSLGAFCEKPDAQKKHQPTSGDRAFTMPDLENEAVTKALITVARMLANLTQPAQQALAAVAETGASDSESSTDDSEF